MSTSAAAKKAVQLKPVETAKQQTPKINSKSNFVYVRVICSLNVVKLTTQKHSINIAVNPLKLEVHSRSYIKDSVPTSQETHHLHDKCC